MTTALSQILKQTKSLSPQEQLELVNELLAGVGQVAEQEAMSEIVRDSDHSFEEEVDASSLKRVPPKDSYEVKVKLVDGGRGKPRRYDFGDLFDEEEGEG